MKAGLGGILLLLISCHAPSGLDAARGGNTDPASQDSTHSSWYAFRRGDLDTLRKRRWALVLHRPTRTLIDSFLNLGIRVEAVYAPEHGLWGEVPAGGMVGDTMYRGVPVYSLYGRRRAPAAADLRKVDAILFALRDVGVRYYTYLSTLSLVLRAAAEAQKPVWVLDFPNPHAHYAYGPLLDSSLFSFVGMYATPLVLGLTIGEYARLLVGEGWIPFCSVHVVPWQGWHRKEGMERWALEARAFWQEAPSPALRCAEAIHLYPVLGWYDASPSVSVGRGTDSAFTVIGWDPTWVSSLLPFRDTVLYGYRLQVVRFVPRQGARKGQACVGWHITPPEEVVPDSLFRLGYALLKAAYEAISEISPEGFCDAEFFDKLAGTPLIRWSVERGLSVEALYQDYRAPESWERLRERYRLYH